jgi:hypothetical protein
MKKFCFRIENNDFKVQSSQIFEKVIFETDRIYAIYIAGIGCISITERFTIAIVGIDDFIDEKTFSLEIADLANIFN